MYFPADDAADFAADAHILEALESGADELFNEDLDHLEWLSEQLRELPPVEPNSAWLRESKARLLDHFDRLRR